MQNCYFKSCIDFCIQYIDVDAHATTECIYILTCTCKCTLKKNCYLTTSEA